MPDDPFATVAEGAAVLEAPAKRAATLTESECNAFIETLFGSGASGSGRSLSTGGRFATMHRFVRGRDEHFYNLKAADQRLPAPHEDVEPYQSDILRKTWAELKARMVENAYQFRVTPPREGASRAANTFETVLQRGFELTEEREDISLQADMADGQIIHGYSILHWARAPYPTFPIADESEEPADGFDDTPGANGKYQETASSRLERDKLAKAKAGFPYYLEVFRADQTAFILDRSMANGMGLLASMRSTSLVEYDKKLREEDGKSIRITSINQYAKAIRIYEERDRPANFDPSADAKAWGQAIAICVLETRDEGYELVSVTNGGASDGKWTLVKSWTHEFGMPPGAVVRAFYTNHPDPAVAYLPALEGGYRIKPFVDRAMTTYMAIANQIALPFYYIKQADDSYMIGPSGTPLMLTRDMLAAQVMPQGATIEVIAPKMDQSLVNLLEMLNKQLADAMPPSGFVEIGASTQPWAIRLGQDQANTIVGMLKKEQAKALRQAAVSIARDMIDLGEPVYVYGKTKDGRVDTTTAIGIEPQAIPTLDIQCDIDPRSSAQAVANIEHLRALLDDPLAPYTPKQFLEEALRSEHPDDDLIEWLAWQTWFTKIRPVSEQQLLAEHFGDKYVVTPDLAMVGPNGVAASPMDSIQANQNLSVTPTNPDGSPVPQSVQAESQPTMPNMPALTAPGTQPMYGG